MAVYNSKEYAWKDIDFLLWGRIVGGITNIQYSRSVEKERNFGRGNKARSLQKGNETIEGTITVHQSELQGLIEAAGENSILEVPPFDIIIRYAATGELVQTIDKIKYAEFSEYEKGMAQNDKMMNIELPFMALKLEENI